MPRRPKELDDVERQPERIFRVAELTHEQIMNLPTVPISIAPSPPVGYAWQVSWDKIAGEISMRLVRLPHAD